MFLRRQDTLDPGNAMLLLLLLFGTPSGAAGLTRTLSAPPPAVRPPPR
jgi:hypothetical protein